MKSTLAMPSNLKPLSQDIKVPALNLRMDQLSQSYFGQLPEMARAGQGRFTSQRTPSSGSSAENNCDGATVELDDTSEFSELAAIQEFLSMPFQATAETEPRLMQRRPEMAAGTSQPESASPPPEVSETDRVLQGVQSTLDSLAGMAHELSQQKLNVQKTQAALDHRYRQAQEDELRLTEQAERLQQLEQSLLIGRQSLERDAQEQAVNLFERRQALQVLEEAVDRRDRAIANRVELLTKEEQRMEQQQAHLLLRAAELDEREIALQRVSDDLAAKYSRLVDAKNRLEIIVKSYSEKNLRLVRGALSAIDKTIPADLEE